MIHQQRGGVLLALGRAGAGTLQALGRALPGALVATTIMISASPFHEARPLPALRDFVIERVDPPAPPIVKPVDAAPAGAVVATATSIRPALVHIPAGGGKLGRAPWKTSYRWEHSQHGATVAAFELCATEVTQGQYENLLGARPSDCGRDGAGCSDAHPVNNVSWYDAVTYLNALSLHEGLTPCYAGGGFGITWERACTGYRLPTETEWEHAARAGGWPPASAPELLPVYAWYGENAYYQRAHPVARKLVNPWGLHDMIGNVDEWVWDEFVIDERADGWPYGALDIPDSERRRAHRGGSYGLGRAENDPAFRVGNPPRFKFWTLGFRCARDQPALKDTSTARVR